MKRHRHHSHRPHGEGGSRVRALCVALLMTAGAAPAIGVIHERGYGEPVGLMGRRLVFTTWAMVRPGKPDWQDDQGKSVYADSGWSPSERESLWPDRNRKGEWDRALAVSQSSVRDAARGDFRRRGRVLAPAEREPRRDQAALKSDVLTRSLTFRQPGRSLWISAG